MKDLPTETMRRDFFTPWAHDRGRQTCFFEVPGADHRWHPLADRDIEAELITLTGKNLIEAELDLIEAWERRPPPWTAPRPPNDAQRPPAPVWDATR